MKDGDHRTCDIIISQHNVTKKDIFIYYPPAATIWTAEGNEKHGPYPAIGFDPAEALKNWNTACDNWGQTIVDKVEKEQPKFIYRGHGSLSCLHTAFRCKPLQDLVHGWSSTRNRLVQWATELQTLSPSRKGASEEGLQPLQRGGCLMASSVDKDREW